AIAPNPARKVTQITLLNEVAQTAEIRLCDLNGRVVVQTTVTLIQGKNQTFLEIPSHLKSGVYALQIKGSQGFLAVEKLIIE
ncbi:MAG: T9SS type A sorting domain-containing protein, partial [Bacteroidia bacterium]|nr:T9SS type A sorting domain-containing protein [Bacteroidia bacterium]